MLKKEDVFPDIEIVSQKLNEMAELLKRVSELQNELSQLGFPLHFDIVKKD